MSNASENNGAQPFTQQTRDTMAQNDHDKIVELTVINRSILDKLTSIEAQVKDLMTNQAAALAQWEIKSTAVHDLHDGRLRKLEDLAIQYVPLSDTFDKRIKKIETDTQGLKDNKNEVLGGWKSFLWISGSVMGILSFIYLLTQLFGHVCFSMCK